MSEINLRVRFNNKLYSIVLNDYRVSGCKWNDIEHGKCIEFPVNKEDVFVALGVDKTIANLQSQLDQANERLGKLEDILEKYDLEVEELDERIYNGAFNYIDKLRAETDRDTWKRACELASETLKQVMGKPLWIGGNIPTPEVKDSDYFYQQAKKEEEKNDV